MSVCTAALGMAGLIFEARHYRRQHRRSMPHYNDEPVREPAVTH
ncbi:conserved transmembrane protein [Mycobacterium kansasii 732]|nr:conserved transmembrane protein [Mycobacterium kansasii 732]